MKRKSRAAADKTSNANSNTGAVTAAQALATGTASEAALMAETAKDSTASAHEEGGQGSTTENEPRTTEATAEPAANVGGKRSAPHLVRLNAARALTNAVKTLSRYDYAQFGIDGVASVIPTLQAASDVMERVKGAGASGGIRPDATVRIRSTRLKQYEDIFTEADTRALVVLSVKRSHAHCRTASGEKALLPLAHLEVDAPPAVVTP